MKKTLVTLALTMICVLGNESTMQAQTAAKWYFGLMLGLDFNSPTPIVLRGGNTAGSGYNVEASTSVTDNAGNLLFMTAADRIYNGNLVDQGISLSTTSDAAQGHMAVPRPGTTNQYYLFTVDAVNNSVDLCGGTADFGSVRGGRYRIVTIGAAGAITVSGETIIAGAGVIAECQLAIPHQNGTDYWWLCHERGSSNIRVYLVTNGGVTHDNTFTGGQAFTTCTYTSVMKVNTCYDQFALSAGGQVSLFNFDYTDGDITLGNTVTENYAYGLEFSPNDNYLYVSTGTQGGETAAVIRYSVGGTLTGRASLGATYGGIGKSGHLQLGPDGVIYVAQMSSYSAANYSHYIGTITNPDGGGTFTNNAIAISDGTLNQQAVTMGLPTILREFITEAAPDIDATNLTLSGGDFLFCPNVSYPFAYTFGGNAASVTWNFGDGTGNFSSLLPVNHTYTAAGDYVITLTVVDGCGRTKVTTKNAKVASYPAAGQVICGANAITLDGTGTNAANYMWFTSATGAPLLASGDNVTLTYNPLSTAPTSVWVQDFTSSTALGTLGPATVTNNEGTNTVTRITTLQNNVFVQSIDLKRYDPGCGCTNGTVTIYLRQGATTLASTTYSIPNTSCGTTQTFNLGFVIPAAGNYTLELSSTGACVPFFSATMYGAFSPITLTGVATNNGASAGNSGPFHNIVLRSAPASCAPRTRIDKDCVLPVEYLFINGEATEEGNMVYWATASEQNNSHFLVQYSANGSDFVTVGRVNGHGTSPNGFAYSFVDPSMRTGTSYYRLVQVDIDNTQKISNAISIHSEGDLSDFVKVLPNPFVGQTTVKFNGVDTKVIELYDVYGRANSSYAIPEGQFELSIGSDLSSGSYILKGSGANTQWHKLIIKD